MSELSETVVTPLGAAFFVCAGILLLVLPRRYAPLPLLATTCLMTIGQKLVIGGLDFSVIRLMLLVAVIRVVTRREWLGFRWGALDTAVCLWAVISVVTYSILWQTTDALVNRLGLAYNAFGLYFTFRMLVRDSSDIASISRMCALLAIPLAVCMLYEQSTGKNLFYVLGGVPEDTFVRQGRLRSQGPFRHPILAGAFGVSMVPYFVGLWQVRRSVLDRPLALVGLASATFVTIAAASSGPLGTYVVVIIGLLLWPMRQYMKAFRWGVVIFLVVLQLAMNAPVWYVLGRLNIVPGSTGWHRSFLIDQFVAHFGDWWLVGVQSTQSWADYDYMTDITNQFVAQGVSGGLLTLFSFLAIFVIAFRGIGVAVKHPANAAGEWSRWCWVLGVALAAHATNFMSVSYVDQNVVAWYLLLAMVSAAMARSSEMRLPLAASQPQRQPQPRARGRGLPKAALAPRIRAMRGPGRQENPHLGEGRALGLGFDRHRKLSER